MTTHAEDPTAEVTDLLQLLIRNQCVNDGTVASGDEARSVDLLAAVPRRAPATTRCSSRSRVARASSPGSRAPTPTRRRSS